MHNITVNTDKIEYQEGETIIISGDVDEILPNVPVSLQIISQKGNLINIQQLEMKSNKKFQAIIHGSGRLWKGFGTYKIVAHYGSEKAQQKFEFKPKSETVFESVSEEMQQHQFDNNQGPSAHVTSDSWTTDDRLGYSYYAHAIYKFLTHKLTTPPLTISIQAPWGGGKTSLMKMIQQKLDPKSVQQSPEEKYGYRSMNYDKILEILENDSEEDELNWNLFSDNKITIWFNAWKYEDGHQIWAGLADAIIRQITGRLDEKDQIRFWLRFNKRHLSIEEIKSEVKRKTIQTWLNKAGKWIITAAGGIIASIVIGVQTQLELAGLGILASVVGGTIPTILDFFNAQKEIQVETSEDKLQNYLHIPEYHTELGLAYKIEQDIIDVFKQIPKDNLPIVIFIDDLDRCSPNRISEIIGAINRFLSSGIPNCFFILGIDTEIISAALEESHSAIISRLPKYSSGRSLGWKFMDKFIQLPIIIPPPDRRDIRYYVQSLLSKEKLLMEQTTIKKNQVNSSYKNSQEIINKLQHAKIKESEYITDKMNERILAYSDDSDVIRKMINESYSFFSINPREIKRFVNLLRFNYFMLVAREERGLEVPSLEQISRWIILSLKWPDVTRWILRGSGEEGIDTLQFNLDVNQRISNTKRRLRTLEVLAKKCKDVNQWQEGIEKELRIKEKGKTAWALDKELLYFFKNRDRDKKYEPLSSSAGKGFY